MMSLKLFQVDAFANKAFEGNPAAVCLLKQGGDYNTQWMQSLAAEMNLSETAFVEKKSEGVYHLRWFTPKTEVNLCGHATLATAHILWTETDLDQHDIIQFKTLSGCLEVSHNDGLITMNFPTETLTKTQDPNLLQQLSAVLSSECKNVYNSSEDILVEIENEAILKKLQPDLQQLSLLPIRCLIITATSNKYDFVSRVFAPRVGIDEDPVTGSTHCALAPFWAEKLGKMTLSARQVSTCGGDVFVTLKNNRVDISGTAITIFKGELL
jgi:PhzF family phenazine biosynthesis protein